ncbi:hypothetical protein DUNSADRAFT_10414 [Dunaliella salina]|uniref:Uncharacterized protein n=1 Tax=Dunaliella salina TaxID=3046 RepID=A0ABQ7GFF3_DUNSA|nr:hypothetical protein DUNSADRAFT_10414 [Dunaliella salina]|eukprot:KAF5833334.1 hypothetical protein DUNSADRAFT_10414 [Dunaliella salina]
MQGEIPFEPFQMAASANQNPGYPGSCGRCYTVRCKPGPVLGAGRGAGPQPTLRPGRHTPRPGVLELPGTEITPDTVIEDASSDAEYSPTATCVTLTQGGGLYWHCRNCSQDGFQPFDGAQAIHFSIKPIRSPSDNSNAPAVPAVKLFVMVDELIDVNLQDGEAVRAEEKKYCNVEAYLGNFP